ncbi:hypothetical protein AAFF_G00076380 [Aldrovandia affinis]|uniref:Uncharacterized protein n=1 Tax=Aldrovandia affinis TaxID=143900 RepID=A0AAD7RXM1_9TELE|nr:hypothetical protein AAFF_G00076380 [Aldrovandia affinis]
MHDIRLISPSQVTNVNPGPNSRRASGSCGLELGPVNKERRVVVSSCSDRLALENVHRLSLRKQGALLSRKRGQVAPLALSDGTYPPLTPTP